MANATPPPDPKNNLEVIQRKGDHLTVIICSLLIVAVHCLGFFFPAYHEKYSNSFFLVVLGISLVAFVFFAVLLWQMTFVEYKGWKITGVILSTVFNLLWVLAWGAGAMEAIK